MAHWGLSCQKQTNKIIIVVVIIIIIIIIVLSLDEGRKVKLTVFCNVTPRRMEYNYEGLGQKFCLCLQVSIILKSESKFPPNRWYLVYRTVGCASCLLMTGPGNKTKL